MTNTEIAVRAVACLIGLVAASLTGFGAWEAQYAQEGGVNYLTLAAPFVVAAAAVIPPIAERLWADHKAKSVFLWLTLVPVAVLAFYAATERVHGIKATGLAERAALATAATLAHDSLSAARASLEKVESDAAEALKLRACKEECRKKWEGEANAARQRVDRRLRALPRRGGLIASVEQACQRRPALLGQGIGAVDAVTGAAELVERLATEYEAARRRLAL